MKKLLSAIFIAASLVFLTGCAKVMELSDSENRAIAEYSAELLLKYATGYESKYFAGATTEEAIPEASTDTQAATTEQQTDTTVPADTNAPATEAPVAADTEYISDISELLGLSGISITYNNYQITDQYPSKDKNGSLIYLDAPEGKKLIVVSFDMKNQNAEPVDVNLLDMAVDYHIIMNSLKTAKPMLTILMDDLSTYEATLAPDSTSNAVLVFQISDNLVGEVQTLDIKVSYNGIEKMIKVL